MRKRNQFTGEKSQMRTGSALDEDSLVRKNGLEAEIFPSTPKNFESSSAAPVFKDKLTIKDFYRQLEKTNEIRRNTAPPRNKPRIHISLIDEHAAARSGESFAIAEGSIEMFDWYVVPNSYFSVI
jgi:hypothetical protein